MVNPEARKNSITRRCALGFLGGTLTPAIALASSPRQNQALTSFRQYWLIDALEEHGQWATGPSWARDIHQSMGANVTVVARGAASGNDSAATATKLALQGLVSSQLPPDGAVVVVYGRPGAVRLRDAHCAYRIVRSGLRPDDYCAYSPLFDRASDDHMTVVVTLGWRINRAAWL